VPWYSELRQRVPKGLESHQSHWAYPHHAFKPGHLSGFIKPYPPFINLFETVVMNIITTVYISLEVATFPV
jgi:hypothetical protein